MQFFHQPAHVAGMTGQQTSAVIVHASNVRYRCQVLGQGCGELLPAHVQHDGAWLTVSRVVLRLQGKMQQHFLAMTCRQFGELPTPWRGRQDRAGNRARQGDRAASGGELVTQIVDDDRDPRPCQRFMVQRRVGVGSKVAGCEQQQKADCPDAPTTPGHQFPGPLQAGARVHHALIAQTLQCFDQLRVSFTVELVGQTVAGVGTAAFDVDIGSDAGFVYRIAGGRVVARRGQLDRTPA